MTGVNTNIDTVDIITLRGKLILTKRRPQTKCETVADKDVYINSSSCLLWVIKSETKRWFAFHSTKLPYQIFICLLLSACLQVRLYDMTSWIELRQQQEWRSCVLLGTSWWCTFGELVRMSCCLGLSTHAHAVTHKHSPLDCATQGRHIHTPKAQEHTWIAVLATVFLSFFN